MKSNQWPVCLVLCFIACVVAKQSSAHSAGVSLLLVEYLEEQVYRVNWAPAKEVAPYVGLQNIQFPDHCRLSVNSLNCGAEGLMGQIRFLQLPLHAEVLIRIQGREATIFQVITGSEPQLPLSDSLNSTATPAQFWFQHIHTYTILGLEHILFGYDHLLFVLGLLLLVGFNRQLVITVTLFTVAHSVTLAMSIFNLLTMPAIMVEIVIALSIVFVAKEILSQRPSLAKRMPWLMALIFGLVHGLGFAGALKDLGLPESAIQLCLFAFNVGVELGQLCVLFLVFILYRCFKYFAWHQSSASKRGWYASCYTLGAFGAFWVIDRGVQFIAG